MAEYMNIDSLDSLNISFQSESISSNEEYELEEVTKGSYLDEPEYSQSELLNKKE